MKILLVNPYNDEDYYQYPVPQLSLGYLSDALKKNGFDEIKIIDFHLLKAKDSDVTDIFKRENPDVIGIRFWSIHISVVKKYIKIIRKLFGEKVVIIVGGPHVSVAPIEAVSLGDINFGFIGEAEVGLPLLLKKINNNLNIGFNNIKGLIWRDQEQKWQVNPQSFECDLDQFQIDWDSLNLTGYHNLKQTSPNFDRSTGKKVKNAFLFCSRGCPYNCKFCSATIISGPKVRYFSTIQIVNYIHFLYDKYGVKHFNIMDDNFTFSKKYVMEFCNEYLKNKLPDVTFASPNGVRCDRLDDEMLAIMKNCGWVRLMIGIESGSPEILKKMNKNIDTGKIRDCVRLIRKNDIQSWGFFILGYPGENSYTLKQTLKLSLELPLDWASFSLFSPIPGTPIYYELINNGMIKKEYEMSSYHQLNSSFSDLSFIELKKAQRLAYLKFYSRPKKIINVFRGTSFSGLLKTGLSVLRG